jgi:hypothetical protein
MNDRIQERKDLFNMDISKQSLQTQINSIKESQRQFTRENEAFLQIVGVKFHPLKIGDSIRMEIEIANMKSNPVKIIDFKLGTVYPKIIAPPIKNLDKEVTVKSAVNMYIIKESPIEIPATGYEPLDAVRYDMMMNKGYNLFLSGYVKYRDLISGKNRFYVFEIKMRPRIDVYENGYPLFMYNENKNNL